MGYALRGMRRNPGFTAVAVLSLALGIGANTAIFSLIHTLILQTLPVREPRRLVEFLAQYPGDPPLNAFSWQSYQHFREANHVFADLTALHPSQFHVRGAGLEPETVVVESVDANLFRMLGLKPAIGRLIGPGDNRAAVVSWAWWNSKFSLDPAIVGRRLVVENVPVTVAGVAPRGFNGLQVGLQPDIWVPLDVAWTIDPAGRSSLGALQLIAQLRPGVSLARARAEMAVLFRATLDERTRASRDPAMRQLSFTVAPAGTGLSTPLRGQFAKPLAALMAVVGLLLLIACVNLANMLLARGAGRRHEMAVRVALGAGRFRLMRQVLTESLLLSAAGGILAIFIAYIGAAALVRIMTSGRFVGGPPHIEMHGMPDLAVLLFTSGVALLTGVLFGLAPAWSASACAPAPSLRDAGRSGGTRRRSLFGKGLVVAQVALSVGLLSAATLYVGRLSNLEHADLGFRRDHVLLLTLDPAGAGYGDESLLRAYENLLARLAAIPGVRAATISAPAPLSGAGAPRLVTVDGFTERPEDRRYIFAAWVAARYFETLGTPLKAGRDFTSADRGRAPVAIVNEAMARYYFGARNPIGGYVKFDGESQPYEIVGVAGDAKYYTIREAPPRIVYLDAFQLPRPPGTFALRTAVDPLALAAAARRTVREVLPDVAVADTTTLADQVDATIVPERLIASLAGLFGALGALLAAIGIYGLLAYTVARRMHEVGIRMALGATRGAIYRMVLWDALRTSCAGVAIGALAARSAFPVAPAAAAMIAITLVAAYVPARRAARLDPLEALRHE